MYFLPPIFTLKSRLSTFQYKLVYNNLYLTEIKRISPLIFFYFRNDHEELPINIFTTIRKKTYGKKFIKINLFLTNQLISQSGIS